MIFSRKSNVAFSAAIAIACCGTIALAQNRAPPGAPGAAAARPDFTARLQERGERRAKAMHDLLNIRPDQEAAFQAYETAMKPDMKRAANLRRGGPQAAQLEPGATPERLDRMSARLSDMQQAFAARAGAIKAFYAVLSPDQRRAFDSLPMLEGGHKGVGMGHMGGKRAL